MGAELPCGVAAPAQRESAHGAPHRELRGLGRSCSSSTSPLLPRARRGESAPPWSPREGPDSLRPHLMNEMGVWQSKVLTCVPGANCLLVSVMLGWKQQSLSACCALTCAARTVFYHCFLAWSKQKHRYGLQSLLLCKLEGLLSCQEILQSLQQQLTGSKPHSKDN